MKRYFAIALASLFFLTGCLSNTDVQINQSSQASPAQPTKKSLEAAPSPSAAESPTDQQAETIPDRADQIFNGIVDMPVIDGSTACLPLIAETISRTCGISLEKAQELAQVSTTTQAYIELIEKRANLLLVYEASDEIKSLLAKSSEKIESTPIGRDALVFIVNEKNPVKSLTVKQLVDIYTGKIKNWKEVGGEDAEIKAFQRDTNSGSQALFMKLVMNGKKPMKAPTEMIPTEMGELMESIAQYNNISNAIGFSVYYYADKMYSQPGLRFMEIEGVMPSDESISKSTYPFLNEFYAVIRKSEPPESQTRKLQQWILSDKGKKCIVDAGYIPVQ